MTTPAARRRFLAAPPSLHPCHRIQAALLRRHVADLLHQRDSLVEAALTLVVDAGVGYNRRSDGDGGKEGNDNGGDCDGLAAQELSEWHERLKAESRDLDPTDIVLDGEPGRNRW